MCFTPHILPKVLSLTGNGKVTLQRHVFSTRFLKNKASKRSKGGASLLQLSDRLVTSSLENDKMRVEDDLYVDNLWSSKMSLCF